VLMELDDPRYQKYLAAQGLEFDGELERAFRTYDRVMAEWEACETSGRTADDLRFMNEITAFDLLDAGACIDAVRYFCVLFPKARAKVNKRNFMKMMKVHDGIEWGSWFADSFPRLAPEEAWNQIVWQRRRHRKDRT
jgi:hypothetical protein